MIKHSKKGLSSLFFRNVPTTVSNSPSAPASNAASKSTSASSDVVITSVYGAAASNPTPATTHSPVLNQTIMDRFVTLQVLVTTAEWRMILRIVKNHDSFRLCLGLRTDLKAMFPDSQIAGDFTLSKTKCAYVVKYGIAPWLKENLRKVISESPFYSISYDESLNRQMEEQQMDLQLRYWCNKTS